MGRQVPTTEESCDGCGATSEENVIYDFMGDYLCCECSTEKFTFFWDGPFSQWCGSPFTINDIRYGCAEQYMMAEKARLFKDAFAEAAILSTQDPEEQKNFGRQIKGYSDEVWQQEQMNDKPRCWNVVYAGNYAKFQQNIGLRHELFKTKGTTLVEASPVDTIWGIGLKASDPLALDRDTWQGSNWLGEVLTAVRDSLIWTAPL